MSAPENPSVFPFSAEYGHHAACGGMSLRDWLAGQALVGRMSIVVDDDDGFTLIDGTGNDLKTTEGVVASCYAIADAMLDARNKGESK